MKKFVAMALAAGMLCANAVPAMAEADYTFALIVMDLSNPFFATMVDAAKAYSEANNIELLVTDGAGDSSVQIAAVENYITLGVDGIAMMPVDGAALIAAPHQHAHLRGAVALGLCRVLVGIRDAVAVDVDDGVGALLKQAFGGAAGSAVCAGVVRQMRRFIEDDVDPQLREGVAEGARDVVDAALAFDRLRAVGGDVALVRMSDVHGDEALFSTTFLGFGCGGDGAALQSKDRLRLACGKP